MDARLARFCKNISQKERIMTERWRSRGPRARGQTTRTGSRTRRLYNRFQDPFQRDALPAGGDREGRRLDFSKAAQGSQCEAPLARHASVEGTFNGLAYRGTLEPDGQGGHWLKVDRKLREAAGAEPGDVVSLEIAPVAEEPEPRVPADLRKALAGPPESAGGRRTSRPSRTGLETVDRVRQAGSDALEADRECLRYARQREATPLLLRSFWDVCQELQLPRRR